MSFKNHKFFKTIIIMSDTNDKNLNGDNSDAESEYQIEEIDLMENPLYQVLSTLLEDSSGNNLCECINAFRESIDTQNKLMLSLLQKLSKTN